MIEGYLVVFGVVSLFMLPALTIIFFNRWPYIWWLIWCLSLTLGLVTMSEPFVPSDDPYARLGYGLNQAIGLVLITSNLISVVIFLFRSKIQAFIPNSILRGFIIYIAAIILVFLIVTPLGKFLKL
jgi:hypothetical protein